MKMKGVIFDFNGTLFLDNDKHIIAWDKIARAIRGRGLTEEELLDYCNGVPNNKIVDYLYAGQSTEAEQTYYSQLKEQYYRQACLADSESFHLIAGAEPFFHYLKQHAIPFTIASASIKENIDFFVTHFHLDQWLDPESIVYDDGSYTSKVEMFKEAARRINVDIRDCTVYEDSSSGIASARECGCSQIVVIDSAHQRALNEGLPGVLCVVDDFQEWLDLILNRRINQLVDYALANRMIDEDDVDYSINLLLDVLRCDRFTRVTEEKDDFYDILDDLVTFGVIRHLIEDTMTQRDLFDTRLMNCVMPRPHEVIRTFNRLYQESPVAATDYFYDLSIHANYIRKARTDKNIHFRVPSSYGDMEISINLSKPEKDPRDIAKAKQIKATGYPKCVLCKENVGFAGHLNHPARQTHRIIPLNLNHQRYYFQYSPYVYYNEHCIVLNEHHVPMMINTDTFKNLFAFLDIFPHYMIGSNADLPIVGGSILSHDHYQGGRHRFPMQDATLLKSYHFNDFPTIQLSILNWPLSTIRLIGKDRDELIALADHILKIWVHYNDEERDIIAYTDQTRHNTITPILSRQNDTYSFDLVLRNNRTTAKYPLGIFHPHPEHHHIKKENIGLIEVLGLAILPGRLQDELEKIKRCLMGDDITRYEELDKHRDWFEELKAAPPHGDIDALLKREVGKKFVRVLENCGVFKLDAHGIQGFDALIHQLGGRDV